MKNKNRIMESMLGGRGCETLNLQDWIRDERWSWYSSVGGQNGHVVSTSGRGMDFCSVQERPFKRGSCPEVEMAALSWCWQEIEGVSSWAKKKLQGPVRLLTNQERGLTFSEVLEVRDMVKESMCLLFQRGHRSHTVSLSTLIIRGVESRCLVPARIHCLKRYWSEFLPFLPALKGLQTSDQMDRLSNLERQGFGGMLLSRFPALCL